MKTEFVKCEWCNEDIASEKCELATYSTIINGKEYSFCCKTSAKEYEHETPK